MNNKSLINNYFKNYIHILNISIHTIKSISFSERIFVLKKNHYDNYTVNRYFSPKYIKVNIFKSI